MPHFLAALSILLFSPSVTRMLIATVLVLIKSFLFLGVTGVKTPFGNAAGFVGAFGQHKTYARYTFLLALPVMPLIHSRYFSSSAPNTASSFSASSYFSEIPLLGSPFCQRRISIIGSKTPHFTRLTSLVTLPSFPPITAIRLQAHNSLTFEFSSLSFVVYDGCDGCDSLFLYRAFTVICVIAVTETKPDQSVRPCAFGSVLYVPWL